MRPSASAVDRLQLAGMLALVLLCAALFVRDACFSPRAPFLVDGPRGRWLQAPEPLTPQAQRSRAHETIVLSREVVLERAPAEASLVVRAIGDVVVRVNGRIVSGDAALAVGPHAAARVEIAPALVAGSNRIELEARRALGPALVHAVADGLELATDERWQVERRREGALGDAPVPAQLADDTRPLPASREAPSSWSALRLRLPAITAAVALALAGVLLLPRAWPGVERALPALATLAIVVLWVAVYATKVLKIHPMLGFDAGGHWEYVQFLLHRRAIPLATDGWSLYHPPLFYLPPAAIIGALGPVQPGNLSSALVKLLPWSGGLVTVLATAAIARHLAPAEPRAQAFSILLAGLLPANLVVSSYFSNESWATASLALAMLACVRIALARTPTLRDHALFGLALALALLTKYTAVVVAPILLFFVALRSLLASHVAPAQAARGIALAAGLPLLLAGWFFARNVLALGTPLPANWGDLARPELAWWQQPGFHTPRFFLGFGESLSHPFYAGFASFWDALYATLWGDGYLGGVVSLRDRHPQWDWSWMSATYPLALPATLVAIAGSVAWIVRALREDCPGRRLARAALASTGFVMLAALATVALRYPYYGQVKAFYVLPAMVPFALAGGDAMAALDARLARSPAGRVLRLAVLALWAAFATTIVVAYAS